MLSDADRKKAAQLLLTAERDRKPMVQLSSTWPSITFEDAYAIQNEVQQQKMAEGRKLIGHKVGLTSKACSNRRRSTSPTMGICSMI
jgi:2-keto-4-pentenoate hydratase